MEVRCIFKVLLTNRSLTEAPKAPGTSIEKPARLILKVASKSVAGSCRVSSDLLLTCAINVEKGCGFVSIWQNAEIIGRREKKKHFFSVNSFKLLYKKGF